MEVCICVKRNNNPIAARFKMKDLGILKCCLGIYIEFQQNRDEIKMSQTQAIRGKIFEK